MALLVSTLMRFCFNTRGGKALTYNSIEHSSSIYALLSWYGSMQNELLRLSGHFWKWVFGYVTLIFKNYQ